MIENSKQSTRSADGRRTLLGSLGLISLLGCFPPVISAADDWLLDCEQTQYGNPAEAVETASGLLERLDSEADGPSWQIALLCRALAHATLGQRAPAHGDLDRFQAMPAIDLPPEDRIRLMRIQASTWQTLGQTDPAIEMLAAALRLAEQNELASVEIELLTNLGVLMGQVQLHDRSIGHLERALRKAEALDDQRRLLIVRYNLGQAYRASGRLADAAPVLAGLIEPLEAPGMEMRLSALLSSLGWIHLGLDDLEQADAYLSRSQRLQEDFDNPAEQSTLLNGMAELRLRQGRLDEAERLADQSLALARGLGDQHALQSAISAKVDVLEAAGRTAEALSLHRERADLSERFLRSQHASRIAELEAELGLERQTRELAALRQSQDLQSLTLQRQQLLILLIVVFVLIIVAALLWQRRVNRRLRRLSRTDPLTGLLNRHALTEALERSHVIARDSRWVVYLMDVDHFKQINDEFGHEVGDRVLIRLARELESMIKRRDGQVARWGGEEFVCLLPAASAEQAVALACELLDTVRAMCVPVRARAPLSVSASLGFVPLLGRKKDGSRAWQPAMRLADELLYRCKSEGRDQGQGIWAVGEDEVLPKSLVAALEDNGRFALLHARPAGAVMKADNDGVH